MKTLYQFLEQYKFKIKTLNLACVGDEIVVV